ncbi:BCCT family transporter [Erysipelothrix urinaevulpis]|uniref:BCCT family transporter n=1 Tax=Erysipelothrix urinaevulpis TaxID=2683717 RepID=UPI00135AFFA6|nr:BCCT family transporter [Erysipelothrix urinaevulpis]
MKRFKKLTVVSKISLVFILLFVMWGAFGSYLPHQYRLGLVAEQLNASLTRNFDWLYTLIMFLIFVLAVYLIVSKHGTKRIGGDDATPDYSTFAWLSMLFSAGMGIGLVFWGVSEPLSHYETFLALDESVRPSVGSTLVQSYVHWGVLPWALYGIMALIIAYFTFNKNRKSLVSASVEDLFGQRFKTPLIIIVDSLVVVSTVFGVATSLGLGAKQIGGGIEFINPAIVNDFNLQLLIILVVTVLFIFSAISGLQKGVKMLSTSAIAISIFLLLTVLLLGPSIQILSLLVTTFGSYVNNFVELSLELSPLNAPKQAWLDAWKIFYWAWWLSWSPYVASFIARISKGRSFREFLLGVIAVPSVFAIIWFSVFGGLAILETHNGNMTLLNVMNQHGPESAIYALFELFGMIAPVLIVIGIVLIGIYFITSADSATFVLAMFSDDGNLVPSKGLRIFWGLAQSAVAIILLMSGNLKTIQSVAVLASFPVIFILILMIINFIKSIKLD